MCPPLEPSGGNTRLKVRGRGEPIRTTEEKAWHSVYSVTLKTSLKTLGKIFTQTFLFRLWDSATKLYTDFKSYCFVKFVLLISEDVDIEWSLAAGSLQHAPGKQCNWANREHLNYPFCFRIRLSGTDSSVSFFFFFGFLCITVSDSTLIVLESFRCFKRQIFIMLQNCRTDALEDTLFTFNVNYSKYICKCMYPAWRLFKEIKWNFAKHAIGLPLGITENNIAIGIECERLTVGHCK